MFEVIICTISTGRVQRKIFDTWEEADRYADRWKAEWKPTDKRGNRYRVEIVRRDLPVLRTVKRPESTVEAA
jgi:hypothetical protein